MRHAMCALFVCALASCNAFSGISDYSVCPDCGGGPSGDASDSSAGETATDTAMETPGETSASDAKDSAPPDAETGATDTGPVDTGCDNDTDGYLSTACGGLDCDDLNPAVNPKADWHELARPGAGFDWNCSGGEEKERTLIFECKPTGPGTCDVISAGWDTSPPPECGVTAKWATACQASTDGSACSRVPSSLSDQIQRCR